jgi:flagellar assembly protein FliH
MPARSPLGQVLRMLSSSRIVFSEDIGGVSPWQPKQFGTLEQPRDVATAPGGQAQALAPGYEDGLREGIQRGIAQARAEAEQLAMKAQEQAAQRVAAVVESATLALNDVQQHFADRVTQLALEIARSVTGLAIDLNIDLIGPAVQRALEVILEEGLKPVVRIHPSDAELFGEALAPLLTRHQASLLLDSEVERGGCLVDTPTGRVDATVAARWQDTLAGMGLQEPWVRSR